MGLAQGIYLPLNAPRNCVSCNRSRLYRCCRPQWMYKKIDVVLLMMDRVAIENRSSDTNNFQANLDSAML